MTFHFYLRLRNNVPFWDVVIKLTSWLTTLGGSTVDGTLLLIHIRRMCKLITVFGLEIGQAM